MFVRLRFVDQLYYLCEVASDLIWPEVNKQLTGSKEDTGHFPMRSTQNVIQVPLTTTTMYYYTTQQQT